MTLPASFQSDVAALFETFTAPNGPGAVVAVTKDGEEIFSGAYGLANINHGVPLDRRSIVRIGSQTKQFTVLLILLLEAEGKLGLDDAVQKHLPYVPRFDHEVTLRHLASNTSGYRDFLEAMIFSGLPLLAPSDRQTGRDAIARQDALNFVPGEAMLYSNSGFFLLSEIIESIEGEPFDAVLKRRITGPLGMADTSLMPRDSHVQPRLAAHYTRRGEEWAHLGWGLVLGGEGGMVSTLEDMLIWQRTLSEPPADLAGPLARMAEPTVYANGTTGLYGLGLVADPYRGRMAVGHGGTVAGGKSESMRFVDDGLGVVILANNDQAQTFSLARRIADLYFGEPAPAADISAAPGLYREENGSDLFGIVKSNGRLAFMGGGGISPLEALSDTVFKPERGITDLHLTARPDGAIDALFCGTPRIYRPLPAQGRAVRSLAGRYRNPAQDLDVVIAGDETRGEFQLRSRIGAFTARLIALDADYWMLLSPGDSEFRPGRPWATMTVTRGGFLLNSERTRGLAFTAL